MCIRDRCNQMDGSYSRDGALALGIAAGSAHRMQVAVDVRYDETITRNELLPFVLYLNVV